MSETQQNFSIRWNTGKSGLAWGYYGAQITPLRSGHFAVSLFGPDCEGLRERVGVHKTMKSAVEHFGRCVAARENRRHEIDEIADVIFSRLTQAGQK